MTERTFTIHREGIDRFTAIVDGDEVIAVRAADYDAMEIARDMCAHMAAEAEAELAHIKRFLDPTGWQKAQDEHNALRARLAEAEADVKRYRWIAAAPRDRASLEWIENKAELDAYIDAFLSPGNTDD